MTERDEIDRIDQEIRIAARPETVFAFLTDPEKILRWKGKDATVDARPGGVYRVDIDGRHIARGAYVEVVPNRRVVFTWGWEDEGPRALSIIRGAATGPRSVVRIPPPGRRRRACPESCIST